MTAVEQKVFKCSVVLPSGIHPKCCDQINKQRLRNGILYDDFCQLPKEYCAFPRSHSSSEFPFPVVKALRPSFSRVVSLVRNVVCCACKGVNEPDWLPQVLWQKKGADREILIVFFCYHLEGFCHNVLSKAQCEEVIDYPVRISSFMDLHATSLRNPSSRNWNLCLHLCQRNEPNAGSKSQPMSIVSPFLVHKTMKNF